MHELLKNELLKYLNNIPDLIWEEIYCLSQEKSSKWAKFGWCNIKYYKYEPPNLGNKLQLDSRNTLEIPHERNVFYPRPRFRFSLTNQPIAYFASEYVVALAETIHYFRYNDNLSFEKHLEPFLDGKINVDPTRFGYAKFFKISKDAVLLNLTNMNNKLLSVIEEVSHFEITKDKIFRILNSKDERVYPFTQQISQKAHSKNFDGIIFNSVRRPKDISVSPYIAVIFTRSKFYN